METIRHLAGRRSTYARPLGIRASAVTADDLHGNIASAQVSLAGAAYMDGDYAMGGALMREVLASMSALGARPLVAGDLTLLVRNTLEEPGALDDAAVVAWAARLWGASEALRERIATPIAAEEMPNYEAAVARARQHLDAAVWEQAWAEGRAMSMEQAVAYAMTDPSTA